MIDLTEVAEALVVRPGDKLLIRVHPSTPSSQIDLLLTEARERLPEVEVTIIGAEQLAVVRGD